MPSPSFSSMTISDYLRILFQRLWIIVICVGGALVVAGFAAYFMEKRYEASMEVIVWQKHKKNPYLKQLLPEESLRQVIDDIRDRLQGQARLRLLARNLRLYVKNATVEKLHPAPESYTESLPQVLRLDEEARKALLARLELVTLGKIFGILEIHGPYALSSDRDSDYLLDENSDDKGDRTILKIARALGMEGQPALEAVRERALAACWEKIRSDEGIRSLPPEAIWELRKEQLAAARLRDLGLYNICVTGQERLRNGLGSVIKSGLGVYVVTGNFMRIIYEAAYLNPREAIPHYVTEVTYHMIRAEYYATEIGHLTDAKVQLGSEITSLNAMLADVNRELTKYDQLVDLQRAFDLGSVEQNSEAFRVRLSESDFEMPRVSIHIRRLNQLEEEKRKLETGIAERTKQIETLDIWLADPDKTTHTRTRTISDSDSPAVVRLKQEHLDKEEALRKILLDSTEKHPMVKKLRQEMEQIEYAINTAGQPTIVKITEQNPRVEQWTAEREEHVKAIAAASERLKHIAEEMRLEAEKAVEVPRQLQEYENLKIKAQTLRVQLDQRMAELEKVEADERAGDNMTRTLFEVHTPAVAPATHKTPRIPVIIGIGAVIGLLAALTAVFFTEYADHSIKGQEDVRKFFNIPVLGTIPEFEFEEKAFGFILRQQWWRKTFGWLEQRHRKEPSRSRRIVAKRMSRAGSTLLLLAMLAALALATVAAMRFDQLVDYARVLRDRYLGAPAASAEQQPAPEMAKEAVAPAAKADTGKEAAP